MPAVITEGLSEPPEGALSGEDVPLENNKRELDESKVETVKNTLKGYEPYSDMEEDKLDSEAREMVMGDERGVN